MVLPRQPVDPLLGDQGYEAHGEHAFALEAVAGPLDADQFLIVGACADGNHHQAADGWVTAYAHNEVVLVARGDMVKRGDIIGRVGSTGNVATPQVHFELRRGVGSVDPVKYLARTSGRLSADR